MECAEISLRSGNATGLEDAPPARFIKRDCNRDCYHRPTVRPSPTHEHFSCPFLRSFSAGGALVLDGRLSAERGPFCHGIGGIAFSDRSSLSHVAGTHV